MDIFTYICCDPALRYSRFYYINQVLSLIERQSSPSSLIAMLYDNVTPQVPIRLPSSGSTSAPSYHRSDLRVYTGTRSPLYHPAPRLHSQLESARTAPLLLNAPRPRRAFSQAIESAQQVESIPTPPPRTRPGFGHKRKISEKLKSIFQVHIRQASEPLIEPPFPSPLAPPNPPFAAKPSHRRTGSAPDNRVAQWVQQQSATLPSPSRPRRSPGTASFVVSSLATEFTFPRYTQPCASTPSLHSDSKDPTDLHDEDDLYGPITAALYPNGKGLLGTTQQRARTEHAQPGMFRFDSSRQSLMKARVSHDDCPPAYDASEQSDADDFSDFAQWYVAPR